MSNRTHDETTKLARELRRSVEQADKHLEEFISLATEQTVLDYAGKQRDKIVQSKVSLLRSLYGIVEGVEASR